MVKRRGNHKGRFVSFSPQFKEGTATAPATTELPSCFAAKLYRPGILPVPEMPIIGPILLMRF